MGLGVIAVEDTAGVVAAVDQSVTAPGQLPDVGLPLQAERLHPSPGLHVQTVQPAVIARSAHQQPRIVRQIQHRPDADIAGNFNIFRLQGIRIKENDMGIAGVGTGGAHHIFFFSVPGVKGNILPAHKGEHPARGS